MKFYEGKFTNSYEVISPYEVMTAYEGEIMKSYEEKKISASAGNHEPVRRQFFQILKHHMTFFYSFFYSGWGS